MRGDESALVRILGWRSPRMLARYRPSDVDRAKEQHAHHNPLHLAELELGAMQQGSSRSRLQGDVSFVLQWS